MSAKTGTELITAVKDHLGDRASGYVGSRGVDDAVLDSVNKAVERIPKKYNVIALQKNLTISVTTAAYKYAVPVTDDSGNTIRIKNIFRLVRVLSGETTGYPVHKITTWKRDLVFPLTNSTVHSGPPSYYSIFAGYIELYPYPDDTYSIYLRVNCFANKITSATQGQPQPLGEEWDDVIEAYATHDMFAKLQEPNDSKNWYDIYEEELKIVKASLEDDPDWSPSSAQFEEYRSNDYQNDPFIRSNLE